jgi:hypothetical protein
LRETGLHFAAGSAQTRNMPSLTRRRSLDSDQETWIVHHGDIRVGTISKRGNRSTIDQGDERCGVAN